MGKFLLIVLGLFVAFIVVAIIGGPAKKPPARVFTQANLDHMQRVILNKGYACIKPVSMRDMMFGGGFVVKCEGRSPDTLYWFNVEDQGGKWMVEPK